MNVDKHFILVKGEDRTEAIRYCSCENGKWQIDFGNGKIYSYNYANVQWLKDPVSHDPSMTVVYHKNQPQYRIDKILLDNNSSTVRIVQGYVPHTIPKQFIRTMLVTIL